MIKIVECPRDAMQGLPNFIPTAKKIEYLNCLLKVGYDTIDFGSFVSHKAIPQMADTEEVLEQLDFSGSSSRLLAIVGNLRGAEDACKFDEIDYLGFPFSISETFQIRNVNSTIEESFQRLQDIQDLCIKHGKEMVAYISMGFGNPYGDPFSPEIVEKWVARLESDDVHIISLADTVGLADAEMIEYLFGNLIPRFPDVEFGAHLHTAPHNWRVKIDAALRNGCRRFDTAINGHGGCPMAKDELIGNMATEHFINLFDKEDLGEKFDIKQFELALRKAKEVFP